MAKSKIRPPKIAKKKSTKYSKLLVVAEKELGVKKKSLVQAERNLARAKQKHDELIAEVARLDMVERSLKALVDGTEPPTSIRYIYQYPNWIWHNTPYVTYTMPQYGYNTVTTPYTSNLTGVLQGGNISVGTTTSGAQLGQNLMMNENPNVMVSNCFSMADSNLNNTIFTSSGCDLTNGSTGTVTFTNPAGTLVHDMSQATQQTDGSMVIDLTTNATEVEETPEEVSDVAKA